MIEAAPRLPSLAGIGLTGCIHPNDKTLSNTATVVESQRKHPDILK
ncbi:hypothetical protein [Burkholderia sp. IDO3]|nr:hypothetical protein [Burkholderia sp. IDO3]